MSNRRVNKFARWKRSAPRRPQNTKRRPRPSVPNPNALPANARMFIHISGQSNALGTDAQPSLTTTQPYDGLRQPGRPGANDVTAIALVEADTSNFGESPASAIANMLHELDSGGRQVIVHQWGVGSTPYSGLEQGSSNYTFGQTGATNARNWIIANRPSEVFIATALVFIHGETDEVNGVTASAYAAFMDELQSEYQADMQALTGQTTRVPMFLVQHSASAELSPAVSHVETAIGSWLAALNNPHIYLACPQYPFAWNVNNPHVINTSARRMGRYIGRTIKSVVLDGNEWAPLHPSAISATNNLVTIDFSGGDGSDLVFDTTNVVRKSAWYGFDYVDTQADIPAITNVALSGPRQVQITLSRNAQSPARVTYANYSAVTIDPGGANLLSAGGNLRDQDTTPSNDGDLPLHNWCVMFDRVIDSVTGSASGSAAFANGQSFDSTGASTALLSARDLSTLNGVADFTIEMYLRSNAATWPTSNNLILSKGASGQRGYELRTVSGAAGRLRLFIPTALGDASNFSDFDGHIGQTWYHSVFVKSGTSLTYYRNGSSIGGTLTGVIPATTTNSLADFELFNSSNTTGANFNLAHVCLYDRALSAGDVTERYNSGTPIDPRTLSTGGPEHYWPGQGTYEDLGSAPTRNLIPYGAITFEPIAP